MRSNCPDLVDKVLNTGDAKLAKNLFNNCVVVKCKSWAVNLTKTSSVDKLAYSGAGGISPSDKGFNVSYHVDGGFVKSDKNTIVKLAKSKELHDLLLLGGQLVDTSDSDDKSDLRLSLDKEASGFLGVSLCVDNSFVSSCVFLGILLSVSSLCLSLFSTLFLCSSASSRSGSQRFGITCSFFLDVLRYNSCPKTNQMIC